MHVEVHTTSLVRIAMYTDIAWLHVYVSLISGLFIV